MAFKTIHTLYGLTRMAQAEATGVPINLSHMAVGDGKRIDMGAGAGVYAGVIARVVIYNRKLTLDEMSLVAAAWQW